MIVMICVEDKEGEEVKEREDVIVNRALDKDETSMEQRVV